jgi:uncharacterized protein with HEPN domain
MSERDWRVVLAGMQRNTDRVIEYRASLDKAGFLANPILFDAVVHNLALIGEGASRMPDEARRANPEIPWRALSDTRNRLIHGYLSVDPGLVWQLATVHVPELKNQLASFRPPEL